MSCFSFLFGRRAASSAKQTVEVDKEGSSIYTINLYTYKELRNTTEDFSPANKIREGGFGSVYKGMLKDGKINAIKVLSAKSKDYLAPEYAVRGQLTCKSDAYSFGVLLLEIVCGRPNTNTRLPYEDQYLLERTWVLHEKRELVGLVDTSLDRVFYAEEACRFLKIGLLRPSMSTVVKMLRGETDLDDRKISKPGLITDFMDLKVRGGQKAKTDMKNTSDMVSSAQTS